MQRYVRLAVIGEALAIVEVHSGVRRFVRRVNVRCDCGRLTTSCGCYKDEVQRARLLKHGEAVVTKRTPEYRAWMSMHNRCLQPTYHAFKHYGGRGIRICDRWMHDFAAFLADVGRRPPGTSLDRINVDGNYEPGNVRWATPKEQVQNQRMSPRERSDAGRRAVEVRWAKRRAL